MKSIVLLSLLFSLSAAAVIPLTGEGDLPKNEDFGDPSLPYVSRNKVEVYTTNGLVLTWKKIDDLIDGKAAKLSHLATYHPDGTLITDIWDPTIDDGVLYGGVLTPPKDFRGGDDSSFRWNRRVYAFRNVNGKWIREPQPLLGPIPKEFTWIDHSYGHHFITAEDGTRYMFYEKVSEQKDNLPWKTEIFARRMKDAFTLEGPEVQILKVNRNWRHVQRSFGGVLAEGPRPFYAKGLYFISFSAGDYTSDDYGIHLMASKNILGPYEPYLNKEKNDLVDLSASLDKELPLTWGGGRAVFFEAKGKLWSMFHGIRMNGEENRGKRNVWLSPVSISDCKGVQCKVKLH